MRPFITPLQIKEHTKGNDKSGQSKRFHCTFTAVKERVPTTNTATLVARPKFAFLNDLFIFSDKRFHQRINQEQEYAEGTADVAAGKGTLL